MDSTPPRKKRRFDVESPKRRSTRNPGRDGGLAGRLAPSPVPGRSSGEAYFGPHDFGLRSMTTLWTIERQSLARRSTTTLALNELEPRLLGWACHKIRQRSGSEVGVCGQAKTLRGSVHRVLPVTLAERSSGSDDKRLARVPRAPLPASWICSDRHYVNSNRAQQWQALNSAPRYSACVLCPRNLSCRSNLG